MNIGLFGLGAIGTMLANCINKCNSIAYFNRSDKVELVLFNNDIDYDRKDIQTNDFSGDLDWLIICVKAYHYKAAIEKITALSSEMTKILIVRNGLDHKASIPNFTFPQNLIPCLIDCSVQRYKNGYLQLTFPKLTVESKVAVLGIEKVFDAEYLTLDYTEDFKTSAWRKLIESAALGGLMCYYGQNISIIQKAEIFEEYKKLLLEIIKVAKSDCADLVDSLASDLITKLNSYPNVKSTSMLSDMKSRRLIELDAKNGIVQYYAQLNNIKTPINDRICKKLNQYNESL